MENETLDIMLGAQIVDLMHRNDVTEIYINDDGHVRYMSHNEGKVKTDFVLKPEKVLKKLFLMMRSSKILILS